MVMRTEQTGKEIAVRGRGAQDEYRIYVVESAKNFTPGENDQPLGKVVRVTDESGDQPRSYWTPQGEGVEAAEYQKRQDAILSLVTTLTSEEVIGS